MNLIGNFIRKQQSGSKAAILKATDIFSALKEHEIEIIARNSNFQNFPPNIPVFIEGEPAKSLYVVVSGEIVVQKRDESAHMIDIARFVKGNFFGELDFFAGKARNAYACASVKTKLLVFPGSGTGLEDLLKEHPAISASILHEFLVVISERIRRANTLVKENSPLIQELRRQVYRDKLTGLFNQIYITEKISEMMGPANSSFGLLMVKPDNFKVLNDCYGHEAGDRAIRFMARALRKFTADDKLIARYKGNAIAVILPDSSRKELHDRAKEIQHFVNSLDLNEFTGGNSFQISTSIGITIYPDHSMSPQAFLTAAHELPLAARSRGGNFILFPEDAGGGY